MESVVQPFLGFHTLVFGLACWILTIIFRRLVETYAPSLKKKAGAMDHAAMYGSTTALWWNEVILYVMPVALGAAVALLATAYPFPEGIQSTSGRAFFGIVVGFLSGFVFKIIKNMLASLAGKHKPGESIAPPSS